MEEQAQYGDYSAYLKETFKEQSDRDLKDARAMIKKHKDIMNLEASERTLRHIDAEIARRAEEESAK